MMKKKQRVRWRDQGATVAPALFKFQNPATGSRAKTSSMAARPLLPLGVNGVAVPAGRPVPSTVAGGGARFETRTLGAKLLAPNFEI